MMAGLPAKLTQGFNSVIYNVVYAKHTSNIPSSLPSFPFTPACTQIKKNNQDPFYTFTFE